MKSAYSQQSSNIRKTWVLLFLFIGLVSSVCLAFSFVYENYFIAFIGVLFALIQAGTAYFFGDKIALHTARARIVTPEEAPEIHSLIDNLSKIADIPKPKVYISPDPSPNAFATGRNPHNASICLNQGILNLLNKNELEGVIAHELSHIKNRDILVMTVTMVLASVISVITDIGFRLAIFGGKRDDQSQSPIKMAIYLITILLAPLVAVLIQLAVSRSREYLADASAIVLTRYPEGLINALQKLYNSKTPSTTYSSSMAHFYISPPKTNLNAGFRSLFSTHPPIEARVEALRKM